MPYDHVTFGLAATGFALLAHDAVRQLRSAPGRAWSIATGAVIAAHVLCVWALRFDWSFAAMWHKSPPAFVLFHTAFALILAAPFAPARLRRRLVPAAFAVVCLGALPAPFRYEEIRLLQIPVMATFLAALLALSGARRRRQAASAAARGEPATRA